MSQENNQIYSIDNKPEIHQTLFIVDKNRKYLFDVNQNILIKKLKQMIVSAADLNKTGLRIFHDGVEYTDKDEYALDELFPDLKYVEFYIQYRYDQIEDLEEIIDLKLQQHCKDHDDKYPYFYCFTCGKSICNKCMLSGAHNGHETKEKYDYLLASKNLVELLFKDLKDILKNTKEGSSDTIDALKAKVQIQFFPKLVELVRKIEENMTKLIEFYLEKEKGNYHTIENNVKLLKSHCEEGLDKLKEEIVIEDIMLDENVFLTFDSKFKEIGKEKEKFQEDINKYKQFSDNLNVIQNVIEKTYNEIYNFLIKYLTVTEFEVLKNQINSQNINVIDKKRILNTLLSDVKRRPNSEKKILKINEKSNPNTSAYYLRSRNIMPNNTNKDSNENNMKDIDNNIKVNVNLFPKGHKQKNEMEIENDNNNLRNNKRYNLRSTKPKEAENYIAIEDSEENNNDNNGNNINTNIKNTDNYNNGNISNKDNTKKNNMNDMDDGMDNTNNDNKNQKIKEIGYTFNNLGPNPFGAHNIHQANNIDNNVNINTGIFNQNINSDKKINNEMGNNHDNHICENNNINNLNNETNQINNIQNVDNEVEEEEEIIEGPIYNIICNIIPSKNQIVLYNVEKDRIARKTAMFSPLLGLSHFFLDCAWVNNNNKLYILGGIDDSSSSSKIFLLYDPIKDKIRRLPDSKYPHSKHSLFAYNDMIYAIGGDNLECEKYDINNNEWTVLPNLSFKQIYPVLYVHNDILYSFFGIDENIKKSDNIQKLNIKNPRGKWQKVNYKRNKCNLCVYGCGIAKINENCVLFLGGMDDNGIRDDAIQFDFSNLTAKKTDFLLEEKAYFKDSILLRLSQKDFGNFSIEDTNPFLKIKFQVNVKKMTP